MNLKFPDADPKRMLPYEEAAHAMQSGVKFDQETGSEDGSPKHLRTGVNSAMVNNAALAKLLIAKGIITDEEYVYAVRCEMNLEKERYEKRLSDKFKKIITLE